MDQEQRGAETRGVDDRQTPAAAEMEEPLGDAEALRSQLEEEKARSEKNLANWQRAEADLSNFRRRAEQERADLARFSNASLIGKLLPVVDDFDRASKTLPPALHDMTWIDGVLLIQRKLQLILESEGVKTIEVKPNDVFDPNIHEAVSHDEALGVESGHVIEELQKGYKLNDRVIRPALVRVAR